MSVLDYKIHIVDPNDTNHNTDAKAWLLNCYTTVAEATPTSYNGSTINGSYWALKNNGVQCYVGLIPTSDTTHVTYKTPLTIKKDNVTYYAQTAVLNNYKLTLSEGTGTSLYCKYTNDNGAFISSGSYVSYSSTVYVGVSLKTGYTNLSCTYNNGSTFSMTGAKTITSSASVITKKVTIPAVPSNVTGYKINVTKGALGSMPTYTPAGGSATTLTSGTDSASRTEQCVVNAVPYGSNVVAKWTPATGYGLSKTSQTESISNTTASTFTNPSVGVIVQDITIPAPTANIASYTIKVTKGSLGSMPTYTPSGGSATTLTSGTATGAITKACTINKVPYGATVVITWTAAPHYVLNKTSYTYTQNSTSYTWTNGEAVATAKAAGGSDIPESTLDTHTISHGTTINQEYRISVNDVVVADWRNTATTTSAYTHGSSYKIEYRAVNSAAYTYTPSSTVTSTLTGNVSIGNVSAPSSSLNYYTLTVGTATNQTYKVTGTLSSTYGGTLPTADTSGSTSGIASGRSTKGTFSFPYGSTAIVTYTGTEKTGYSVTKTPTSQVQMTANQSVNTNGATATYSLLYYTLTVGKTTNQTYKVTGTVNSTYGGTLPTVDTSGSTSGIASVRSTQGVFSFPYGATATVTYTGNTGYTQHPSATVSKTMTSNQTVGEASITTLNTYTLTLTGNYATKNVRFTNASGTQITAASTTVTHGDVIYINGSLPTNPILPSTSGQYSYKTLVCKVNNSEVTAGSTTTVSGNLTVDVSCTRITNKKVTITNSNTTTTVKIDSSSGTTVTNGMYVAANTKLYIAAAYAGTNYTLPHASGQYTYSGLGLTFGGTAISSGSTNNIVTSDVTIAASATKTTNVKITISDTNTATTVRMNNSSGTVVSNNMYVAPSSTLYVTFGYAGTNYTLPHSSGQYTYSSLSHKAGGTSKTSSGYTVSAGTGTSFAFVSSATKTTNCKVTLSKCTGSTLSAKLTNSSGATIASGNYVAPNSTIYVAWCNSTHYYNTACNYTPSGGTATSITNGGTFTISKATTIATSGSTLYKHNVTIPAVSGNVASYTVKVTNGGYGMPSGYTSGTVSSATTTATTISAVPAACVVEVVWTAKTGYTFNSTNTTLTTTSTLSHTVNDSVTAYSFTQPTAQLWYVPLSVGAATYETYSVSGTVNSTYGGTCPSASGKSAAGTYNFPYGSTAKVSYELLTNYSLPHASGQYTYSNKTAGVTKTMTSAQSVPAASATRTTNCKVTLSKGSNTSLTTKVTNSSGNNIASGNYVAPNTSVYVTFSNNTGYYGTSCKYTPSGGSATSISSGGTFTITKDTTVTTTAATLYKHNVVIPAVSGNVASYAVTVTDGGYGAGSTTSVAAGTTAQTTLSNVPYNAKVTVTWTAKTGYTFNSTNTTLTTTSTLSHTVNASTTAYTFTQPTAQLIYYPLSVGASTHQTYSISGTASSTYGGTCPSASGQSNAGSWNFPYGSTATVTYAYAGTNYTLPHASGQYTYSNKTAGVTKTMTSAQSVPAASATRTTNCKVTITNSNTTTTVKTNNSSGTTVSSGMYVAPNTSLYVTFGYAGTNYTLPHASGQYTYSSLKNTFAGTEKTSSGYTASVGTNTAITIASTATKTTNVKVTISDTNTTTKVYVGSASGAAVANNAYVAPNTSLYVTFGYAGTNYTLPHSSGQYTYSSLSHKAGGTSKTSSGYTVSAGTGTSFAFVSSATKTTNCKVTLSKCTGSTLSAKLTNSSGATIASGNYITKGSTVYVTFGNATGYTGTVCKYTPSSGSATSISSGGTFTCNADTTIATSGATVISNLTLSIPATSGQTYKLTLVKGSLGGTLPTAYSDNAAFTTARNTAATVNNIPYGATYTISYIPDNNYYQSSNKTGTITAATTASHNSAVAVISSDTYVARSTNAGGTMSVASETLTFTSATVVSYDSTNTALKVTTK